MDIRLVVETGPDAGQEFHLRRGVVTLGRSPDNSIMLSDTKVSRSHAEIRWKDGVFVIRDLGSRNGTFVNGLRLTDPQVLKPGDRVRLGDTNLIVQEEPKSVRPSDWVRRGRRGYKAWERIQQEERERAEHVSREGQPQAERSLGSRPAQPVGGASPLWTTAVTVPLLIASGVVVLIIAFIVVLTRAPAPSYEAELTTKQVEEQGMRVGEHFNVGIIPSDPDPDEDYQIRVVTRPPVPGISIEIHVSGTDGFHCVDSGTTDETGSTIFPTTGGDWERGVGGKIPGAEEGVIETIQVVARELDQEESFKFVF